MFRKLIGLLSVAVLLCVGVVLADTVEGVIKKVDVDKKTITVEDKDGKEHTYAVDAKADLGKKGKDGAEETLESLAARVEKAGAKGVKAQLTTETKKGKEVVTKVERKGGKGKGKDKGDK
jgi:nucleotide-binding universal stress UspA family protein